MDAIGAGGFEAENFVVVDASIAWLLWLKEIGDGLYWNCADDDVGDVVADCCCCWCCFLGGSKSRMLKGKSTLKFPPLNQNKLHCINNHDAACQDFCFLD